MAFDFNSLDHVIFMREALKEARAAMQMGERPIGAVIVHNGQIVGRGRAEHIGRRNRLAHAEMNALMQSAAALYDFEHDDAVIYTTLEPCEMCLGVIVMSDAVNHIVYAMADRWINLSPLLDFSHIRRHIKTYLGGVLAEESEMLWQQYNPDELHMLRHGLRP